MVTPLPNRDPSTSPPDPRVAAAAAGDRVAAQALLSELFPRVRNLVRYLIWGDVDVDDVAQLVLVELLRSFRTYRGEGSLAAWSDRITTRVTLRFARKRRNDERQQTALVPELHAVPSGDQPDDYTLRREAVRCLDELPEEQRQAVVLHHVVGMSVPELAQELGIPFETVRSRLRLGTRKLRERFDRRGDET